MNIKYKPTNIVFNLPDSICEGLISSDRANYELVKETKTKNPPANNSLTPKKNTTSKANQKAKTIDVKGEVTKKPANKATESENQ